MALASVLWPDFSAATATDIAPLAAIEAAVLERAAVIKWRDFAENGSLPAPYCCVSYERLSRLRFWLLSVAGSFLAEGVYEDDWSDCPRNWSESDLCDGDHSLAQLPAPGTAEANADALAIYRTFLANCAWWIGKLHVVSAVSDSYATHCIYGNVASPEESVGVFNPYANGFRQTATKSSERGDEWWYSGIVIRNHAVLTARAGLLVCGGYKPPRGARYEPDTFGVGLFGSVVGVTEAAPHTAVEVYPETIGTPPRPTRWAEDPGGGTLRFGVRLLPILDFGPYFAYGRTA